MRAPTSIALLGLLLACGKPSTEPASPAPAPPATAGAAATTSEPPADVVAAGSNESAPSVKTRPRRQVVAPPSGCVLHAEQALSGETERAIAIQLGGAAAVVGFAAGGRRLELWTLAADGRFARGAQLALDSKLRRGSALCGSGACELALVDERGKLLALRVDRQFSPPRTLASGVDRRFAPALARIGERVLYAYTATPPSAEPQPTAAAMHTFYIASLGGKLSPPRDLTPAGHGAAAPAFVLGDSTPTLVAIDARTGFSPLLELRFDATGEPSTPIVRTPVNQPYEPPSLIAVQWPSGEVEVAYGAVGRLAMSAIGRVPLRRASEPSALSPSRGYGELFFAAARSERRALFALEVPVDSKPNAERTIALKLLDGARSDDGPSLPADARYPSLARTGEPGAYVLAYSRRAVLQLALVHCAD